MKFQLWADSTAGSQLEVAVAFGAEMMWIKLAACLAIIL